MTIAITTDRTAAARSAAAVQQSCTVSPSASRLATPARQILETEIPFIGRPHLWQPVPKLPTGQELDLFEPADASQEVALFRAMNWARFQAELLRRQLNPADIEDEAMAELTSLLQCATAIRNRLVCAYRRLAWPVVTRLANAAYPVDELMSEALVTLLRAVEKFDCDRGFRFSTYATHAMTRNLLRYVTRQRKLQTQFVACEHLDAVADQRRWTPLYQQRMAAAQVRLEELIGRLGPREQLIVRARFGLGESATCHTLQSIAERLGVSRERVRQLEVRAMARLAVLARHAQLNLVEP